MELFIERNQKFKDETLSRHRHSMNYLPNIKNSNNFELPYDYNQYSRWENSIYSKNESIF